MQRHKHAEWLLNSLQLMATIALPGRLPGHQRPDQQLTASHAAIDRPANTSSTRRDGRLPWLHATGNAAVTARSGNHPQKNMTMPRHSNRIRPKQPGDASFWHGKGQRIGNNTSERQVVRAADVFFAAVTLLSSDSTSSRHLHDHNSSSRQRALRVRNLRTWNWITLIALAIAAGIGGYWWVFFIPLPF